MAITKISTHGINDGTIVNADINASAAIASTKLSGVTIDIKAFVRFNGTTNFGGDCSIDSSRNVSSVTDLGTGEYRINFITAITDANYSAVGSAQSRSIGNDAGYATGSMTIQSRRTDDFALSDSPAVNVAIFR